jgi:hypothetical protein
MIWPTMTIPNWTSLHPTSKRIRPTGFSGDDPMTGAQASYLRTLAEQAHELDAFSQGLSKAEASRRIDALRAKLKLQDEPPHTL